MGEHRVVDHILRAHAAERPDARCCSMERHTWTYAEMDRRAEQVAAGFAALGVAKGDRVAIMAPNRVETLLLFFGLARLGAIQVPLNVYLKGAFLEHQLRDSAATVLVADADGLAAAKPLLEELPDLKTIINLDEEALPSGDAAPEAELVPDDVLSILYTSGTTGMPKGCVLPNGYYCRAGRVNGRALELSAGDALFCMLPLFHSGGRLLVLMAGLTAGIPVAFDGHFSARNFFPRAIETEATVVIGMGAMGAALLALPPGEAEQEHSIHTMMVAPMSVADQERFSERFGIDPWVEVMGQTECVPIMCSPRNGTRDRDSCGMMADDLEVALLDDDGLPVAPGEPGEICPRPRGPLSMFAGYWNQPEATLQAYRNLWYHTGDMARQKESGAFVFVDRKKDSIRRRAENVSSMELEGAIRLHEAVKDVAVHAVPSPMTEDDIKVVIELAGDQPTPEALFEYFAANLPYYAIPRYVDFAELPRNAVGRVMKHILREKTDHTWDLEAMGFAVAREDRRK